MAKVIVTLPAAAKTTGHAAEARGMGHAACGMLFRCGAIKPVGRWGSFFRFLDFGGARHAPTATHFHSDLNRWLTGWQLPLLWRSSCLVLCPNRLQSGHPRDFGPPSDKIWLPFPCLNSACFFSSSLSLPCTVFASKHAMTKVFDYQY